MVSHNYVVQSLLFVLIVVLTAVSSSGIPPADLERLLTDPDDEPLPPGFRTLGPSHVLSNPAQHLENPSLGTVATRPVNLEGTWLDILHRQQADWPGPSSSYANPAQTLYHPASQVPGTASAQPVDPGVAWRVALDKQQAVGRQTSVDHQPADLLNQYLHKDQATTSKEANFLSSIEAPKYTAKSRTDMLDRVKSRIYEAVDVDVRTRSGAIFPFQEPLTKLELHRYAIESQAPSDQFGTWPLEISTEPGKTERFLVNQAHPRSDMFVKTHGSKATSSTKVYLDVWHEIHVKDSKGVYGYIGAIRAPALFSSRKAKNLIPSAIHWQVLQPLSTSAVIASLKRG
ncbi:uncharacterized protein UTRI_02777 [Ustilago trichophora]|uniref:Effector family protein Eff1 n=1 Tax=Ustilago trichophora TaxID=86804 RepID=A0A5C3EQ21_9BASI|nr:uncharacterized protein UTRI_02777 [Ustilago trichophora]